jgi:hypothetical protein
MSVSLTKDEINYYKKGCDNLIFTTNDAEKVDSERMESITAMATMDVSTKTEKRKQSEFKNAEEYKYYQLAIYSAASRAEHGLL